MTAEPRQLVIDPGDGGAEVMCAGPAPEVTVDNYDTVADDACAYTYPNSSAMAANGETFPLTATIVWHASWSTSTGEGGVFASVLQISPNRATSEGQNGHRTPP